MRSTRNDNYKYDKEEYLKMCWKKRRKYEFYLNWKWSSNKKLFWMECWSFGDDNDDDVDDIVMMMDFIFCKFLNLKSKWKLKKHSNQNVLFYFCLLEKNGTSDIYTTKQTSNNNLE